MSWKDRIENDYVIITGDGNRYTPEWLNAAIQFDFNLSTFEFPNIPGTLVDRRQPKARAFSLELYFQGDSHLQQAERFRISASDPRPWTIIHPFYDQIIVQPVRLRFDNSKLNLTIITGTVLETIQTIFPTATLTVEDEANQRKTNVDQLALQAFDINVSAIPVTDITTISSNIDLLEATGNDFIADQDKGFDFRNQILEAKASLTLATSEPLTLIGNIQEAINFPFLVETSVRNRVNLMIDQFQRVTTSLGVLTGLNKERKAYFETLGSSNISSIGLASITNPDYESRTQVTDIMTTIVNTYNSFIENLDILQSENINEEESFTPNADNLFALENLVNFVLANLFDIAFSASQENELILSADTNIIELTHRIYGLDEDDENIDRLIENNEIGLTEILNVPKGRSILYYV